MIFPDGTLGAQRVDPNHHGQAELARRVLSRLRLKTGKSREQLVREVLAADPALCRLVENETGRPFEPKPKKA